MSTSIITKDLNEAAFIWCQSEAIMTTPEVVMDKGSPTVFFKFTVGLSQKEFDDVLSLYRNAIATVEPLKFCQKQLQLRTLIHELVRKYKTNRSNHE